MRLQQGQIWQQGDEFYRIVEWARLSIDYKVLKDPESKEGTLHHVSKKEFCRMLKGAVLLNPQAPRDLEGVEITPESSQRTE